LYLAENLKFLREQNGKTQGELAVLFGIEQKTISSWECGSRKPPIGTIVSLAKLYRVSLDDLVLTDMRPPIPVYALNLAYLRKKYGMTQQELVEIIGLKNKSSMEHCPAGINCIKSTLLGFPFAAHGSILTSLAQYFPIPPNLSDTRRFPRNSVVFFLSITIPSLSAFGQ
jgi:transcriptional regulator with XRE-family HTH domain